MLKALEVQEEYLPTDNQPEEEVVEASVGGKSKFKTPSFLLTFEIFNYNMHNYLVESINVMPLLVCKKINGKHKPSTCQVVQLDRTVVKVIGEMEDVLIRLSANEKVYQHIDIVVADIPDVYGFVLSRD